MVTVDALFDFHNQDQESQLLKFCCLLAGKEKAVSKNQKPRFGTKEKHYVSTQIFFTVLYYQSISV
jgi:hypothetical protein